MNAKHFESAWHIGRLLLLMLLLLLLLLDRCKEDAGNIEETSDM